MDTNHWIQVLDPIKFGLRTNDVRSSILGSNIASMSHQIGRKIGTNWNFWLHESSCLENQPSGLYQMDSSQSN